MQTKTVLASLLATLAVALVPAVALADDPGAAVKTDIAKLSADVKTAHDALLADLAAITADAGKGDETATKADVRKFRADRRSSRHTIRSDRRQLRNDLKAAHEAKVDPSTLKPLLQAARADNKALLEDLHQAATTARAAAKALLHASKP